MRTLLQTDDEPRNPEGVKDKFAEPTAEQGKAFYERVAQDSARMNAVEGLAKIEWENPLMARKQDLKPGDFTEAQLAARAEGAPFAGFRSPQSGLR